MIKKYLLIGALLGGFSLFAQNDQQMNLDYVFIGPDSVGLDSKIFDLSIEKLLELDASPEAKYRFKLYGFLNSNLEKVYANPSIDGSGKTVSTDDPAEWSPVKNFHIYASQEFYKNISIFFNLAHHSDNGDLLEIRNAYGNFKLKDILQVRVGKMYRRFGLYNERLDQIPTFIGIEAPELFDKDHLFLTRTTNFMVHGDYKLSEYDIIQYALTTDNGEGGPSDKATPLGWDLRLKSQTNSLIVGTSGYTSGGEATSTVAFNNGSANGGILPWMEKDNYQVFGLFAEKQLGNLLIQAEYYTSPHQAVRNADNTLDLVQNANINSAQRTRFLGDNASKDNKDLTSADVVTKVNYTAQTWYVRLGYDIFTDKGQFIPYLFLDYMFNPELIQNKSYGGDNETGLSDDGKIYKPSLGLVYRPVQEVAIKLDGSLHMQKFNGQMYSYPEIRLDFSFAFDAMKHLK